MRSESRGRLWLSVDFDFFVPSNDLVIEANTGSLEEWRKNERWIDDDVGIDLRTEMDPSTCKPPPGKFWDELARVMNLATIKTVVVCDDHRHAYMQLCRAMGPIAKGTVLNFDAHHDIFYYDVNAAMKGPDCGSWLGRMLIDQPFVDACWVYPLWSTEHDYQWGDLHTTLEGFGVSGRAMLSRVKSVAMGSAAWRRYIASAVAVNAVVDRPVGDTIVIARSSPWTPPWLDAQFNAFVMDLLRLAPSARIKRVKADGFDPMVPREKAQRRRQRKPKTTSRIVLLDKLAEHCASYDPRAAVALSMAAERLERGDG